MQTAINIPTISYDNYSNKAPFTLRRRNLKTEVHSENASNVFRSHYAAGGKRMVQVV